MVWLVSCLVESRLPVGLKPKAHSFYSGTIGISESLFPLCVEVYFLFYHDFSRRPFITPIFSGALWPLLTGWSAYDYSLSFNRLKVHKSGLPWTPWITHLQMSTYLISSWSMLAAERLWMIWNSRYEYRRFPAWNSQAVGCEPGGTSFLKSLSLRTVDWPLLSSNHFYC